ncbi:MAG: quinone oxidoreductase [Betaproteobacteria bacterium]|nr:quinone oxidoreductase [Betaproteobacteria bacterium]
MPHAIRIHSVGGPEVMKWEPVEVGAPGPGELRVKHTAVGLNYIDTYHRTGAYPIPLPFTLGMEGAGVVEAIGANVSGFSVGDRVAYANPIGSYCEVRLMPAERAVKIPAGVTDQQAASMMLKGMTAQYLLRRTYAVQAGDTILVHAAAGGVGLILCQWGRHLGATVIGTVGDETKAELARAHGAHHTILYRKEDWVAKVADITGGKKCRVVYDGVGKDTFLKSLDCLQPFGLCALYGAASGKPDALDTGILAGKGSLYVTRPTLFTYTASRDDLVASANDLFDVVSRGVVKIKVNQTYALKDAAEAHADLENRKTTGSTVFTV